MAGPPDEESSKQRLEHLLAECLELIEAEGSDAVQKLIRENPEQADDLRKCLGILGDLSLVDEPDGDGPLLPGPVGDFRPLKRIGVGGMGEVYLAEQISLRRVVALKLIRPAIASPMAKERFRREALAVARIKHPGIVEIYAAGEQDGQLYIAMEYVPGRGLDEIYRERAQNPKAYTMAQLLSWSRDVADALAAAHAQNLVHRDVKPSNIRITLEGRAVLLDFGLARHLDAESLSLSGAFVGSAAYAAPEQVAARRGAIGPRTDVYGLGATLYEGATGRTPFSAESAEALFHQILHQEPPSAGSVSGDVAAELETVLAYAMAKAPEHRYTDASTLADDLAALRDGRSVSVRPVSTATRMLRWARREPLKASLSVMTLLIMGLGWFFVDRTIDARDAERLEQIEADLERGYDAHADGRRDEAVETFERVLAEDGDNVEALAGLGLAFNRANEGKETIRRLDARPDLLSKSAGLRAVRAAAVNLEQGVVRDRTKASMEPKTPIDHFLLCNIEYGRGTPEADRLSLRHARKAVFTSKRRRRLYFHALIRAACACEDREVAQDALETLSNAWPDDPETWYNAGRVYEEIEPERAAREFERYLEARPKSSMGWFYLGNVRYGQGDTDAALACYDRATELLPMMPAFAANAAHILNARGDTRGALQRYLHIVEHSPREEQALEIALQLANKVGDWKVVHDLAGRVVALNGEDVRGHWLLGVSAMNTGDFEAAERHLVRAREMGPNDGSVGNALERLDVVKATAETLESIRGGAEPPDDPLELCTLAHVASLEEDYPLAARLYARAARKDPDVLQDAFTMLYGAGVALVRGAATPAGTDDEQGLRRSWRELGRRWLADAFEEQEEQFETSPAQLRTLLELDWMNTPHLASVREPELSRLAPEEQAAWTELWRDVGAALDRTGND